MNKSEQEYSLLIVGSRDNVLKIMNKYNIKLVQGRFAKNFGYYFKVQTRDDGWHPVLDELSKCDDIIALSRQYAVISEDMQKNG